ncbi:DEAD/DEAH box helicase [Antrihabitans stalactiti]|uniref:Probable helicase HelY n=1 Tax=Antrihabitans stalactiti TaxID=2584121 RepID=A0A848KKQ4_9NOCA|nr:RNA helicase [Antrihabitans stalactiti]
MTESSRGPQLEAFAAQLSFPLDPFQVQSCAALEDGHGVLVCAPTGAGKTVVGEFAVHLALETGGKCFYTTPIKALSNQKFNDLTKRYGAGLVGLLTGDQSINSDAPVVVMTTEVLRNMIYASSSALRGLSFVVMDEVHFLADRFRGAVWEEVILHLPEDVRLVSLSATVSNAEEFGAWMETVRGNTTIVVDETRPVPLWQHILVGRRMFDLFDTKAQATSPSARLVIDQELVRHLKQRHALDRHSAWEQRGRGRPGQRGNFRPAPRPEVIARLDEEGLLPAITFIFSRAGCDAALAQCVRSKLDLTAPEQLDEITSIIERHTGELPRADLEVLGYWEWREALERGIATHHAGMLPAFRHTVEELFVKGLVRAVFATETLALGINMPARTVVLEKLVKYNGETHADLTPGEYTQLTGRAGRRGIDIEGHAVVLWTPELDANEVAGLASTRTYPLRSSFRPGYNMSINLIDRMGAAESRALLERSFAQFQADRSVVGLVRGIERNTAALAELREQLGGDDGEYLEYAELRERLKNRERALEREGRVDRRGAATESLNALRRGDVIAIPVGRRSGLAVILEAATDQADPRPLVLTEDKWAGRISSADFNFPAEALGRMRLPKHVDHRTARSRRDLASALRSTGIVAPHGRRSSKRSPAAEDRELATLRRAVRAHPCHTAPNREQFSRVGERYSKLARETESMRQKVAATTNSLARTFDRILALLGERGYIADGKVTEDGRRLRRIYSESDLLVSECLRQGQWRGLAPAELAAVVSAVVYESRSETGYPIVGGPTGPIRHALAETMQIWTGIRADEVRHKLPLTREPDFGFVTAIYNWARGEPLVDALVAAGDHGKALSAGDFVRWCRQVIDLLDQVHDTADDPQLRSAAVKAVKAIRRGVVAVDAA